MITFDSASANTTPGGSISWTHTCTGANRLLVVAIASNASVQHNPSSVTYNGVAMTKIAVSGFDGANASIFLYYLINPATGANTVSATCIDGIQGVAASYTGAKQSVQPDSYYSAGNSGSTPYTVTITNQVQETNCWQILAAEAATNGVSISTTNTSRENVTVRSVSGVPQCVLLLCDTNGIVSPGSQSMNWTANAGGSGASSVGIILTIAADNSYYPGNALFFAGN